MSLGTDTDAHSLAGPYVLDALPPHERTRFEHHLDQCATCRQETLELSTTAARLAAITSAAPPARLREQVRSRISQVRQLPPEPLLERPARRGLHRRQLLLAAAAVVALAAGTGLTAAELSHTRQAAHRQDHITAIVAAPDATTLHGDIRGGGRITAVVSKRNHAAVVILDQSPKLPDDKTYQLWIRRGSRIEAAGTLQPNDTSTPTQILRDAGTTEGISMTIEPRGGSQSPTTPVIAHIAFD